MRTISFIIVFTLVFSYCKNNKFNNPPSNENRLINLSELQRYDPFNLYTASDSQYLVIIPYVNASCPSCIEEIRQWAQLSNQLASPKYKKTNILPVLYSKDEFKLIHYLIESHRLDSIPFYFLLDNKNNFLEKNNNIKSSIESENVYLVDSKSKVLKIGNPLHSQEIKNEYLELLKKN